MNLLLWILFGLITGWTASIIMKTDAEQGAVTDIILGVLGAFVGGFLFNLAGVSGITGFNIWSLIVAVVGAVALIGIGRAFSNT